MAELFAVVLTASLQKAKSIALNHIDLMLGFPQQLNAMEGHVKEIEAVLADAESKKTDDGVSLWLNNVSEVVFDAEIVLDERLYESLRRQVLLESNGGTQEVCSSYLFKLDSSIRDIYFSVTLSRRVQNINANFEKLNSRITDIRSVSGEHPVTDRETNSLTHRFDEKRVEEETEIVKLLLDSSNNNSRVSVLPIYGLGGLGKTYMAKSVYNNPEIKGRFSKRSWTCVSKKVGCTDILKGILESLRGGNNVGNSQQGQDAIVQGIEKELNGERFLFVLDDVWEFKWWEKFLDDVNHMAGLNSTGGGCCVLITTRLEGVANEACASPFRLKQLSDDQCWSIIVEKVEEGGKTVEGLEVYKEQILKRCHGLPLAANAIGGLLRREDWGSIMDLILKIKKDVEGEIGPVLKLSYDYLPSRDIKKCFVYCSIYPKDARLDGEKLIRLWMAEGFLEKDVRGGRTMEEVGAHYLTILVQSSLLEKQSSLLRKNSWPLIEEHAISQYYFQMHDLVHDLAESISKKQHPACRHIVFLEGNMKMHWNEKSVLAQKVEGELSDEMFNTHFHARVMHLSSSGIQKLPNAIAKLKHVRCLTLSCGGIKRLPESLCNLYSLQTLRLSDCKELDCLPQGLSKLISLRHLYYGRNEKLKMAPNMGRLTRLQTLEYFNVGEENGCKIKELGLMENIKGSLGIGNLELVEGKEEATSAKLDAKENIIQLELNWGSITGRKKGCNWDDEQVLEGLEPCPGLQHIKIKKFMGIRSPGWLGKLSSLVSLKLEDCENIKEFGYSSNSGITEYPGTSRVNINELGNLVNLKTLDIWRCRQLSSVRTSFPILEELRVGYIQLSGAKQIISSTKSLRSLWLQGVSGIHRLSQVTAPRYCSGSVLSSCLKKLVMEDCRDLTQIPSSTLECCTCLELLKVSRCPNLVSFPLNLQQTPCLSSIQISDCPKLFTRDAVLPRGFEHLTNLKDLEIGQDNSEQSTMDWEGLRKGCSTTLRHLTMFGSSRTQLPQQLQDFSSLVKLKISEFGSLERLPGWLGKLTSLQRLELLNCPRLQHLPMDAIRILTNLQLLHIEECPLLRETQRDEISKALPNLHVDWKIVPSLGLAIFSL